MRLKNCYLPVCIFLLLPIAPVKAQSKQAVELSLGAGYQQENFRWSIAGNSNGQNPNIYSELKWKKIGGPSIHAALQWNIWKALFIDAAYSRAFLTTGTVSDKDYAGDNRTQNIYDETFSGREGFLQSFAAGVGYNILQQKKWTLAPAIGYTILKQRLFLADPGGTYSNLHSSYQTNWKGPYIKINTSLQINNHLKLAAGLGFQQLNYTAKANWNLIDAFSHPLSFKDDAKGYGLDGNIRYIVALGKAVNVYAGLSGYHSQTSAGVDELYLATGEVRKTQFNEAVRTGFHVFAGCAVQIR